MGPNDPGVLETLNLKGELEYLRENHSGRVNLLKAEFNLSP